MAEYTIGTGVASQAGLGPTTPTSRNLVRLSDGTLVAGFWRDGNTLRFYSSGDDGQTWTQLTGDISSGLQSGLGWSLVATANDELHCAYTDNGAGPRIVSGTLSGTTITWGTVFDPLAGGGRYVSDMVAWRVGSNTYAAIGVWASLDNNLRIIICVKAEGGNWSTQQDITVETTTSWTMMSLDFHHTGDGQTVSGGTPHVYYAFRENGSSFVRMGKLTYSAGPTWANSSRTAIHNSTDPGAPDRVGPVAAFDGTDFWMASAVNSSPWVNVSKRDAANLTTTAVSPGALGTALITTGVGLLADSASGDIVIVANHATDNDLYTNRYNGSSWSGWTVLRADTSPAEFIAARHRYGLGFMGIVMEDPGDTFIFVEGESFNEAPTAPTVDIPASGSVADVAETLTIDWTFNDPDLGDTQSAYSLRRQVNAGALAYWDGSTWAASESASTKIATSATEQTLAASWGTDGDSHSYAVKTWDAADAGPSAWSTAVTITASAQDNPTLTAPTDTGTVGATATVSWTVTTQTAYRVVVSNTSSTTDMNAGTLDYDTGWIISTSTSVVASFPTNGVTRYVRVKTKNNHGLESDIDQHSVTVTYTPPTPPTAVVTEVPGQWITVQINDASASTDIASYQIYRRVVGDTSNGILLRGTETIPEGTNGIPFYTWIDYTVASGVDYEYRIKAIGDNGSAAFSSWVS